MIYDYGLMIYDLVWACVSVEAVGYQLLAVGQVMDISDSVSEDTINTDWKPGTDTNIMPSAMIGAGISTEWERAYWSKGRPGIAYAESVSVAWKIPLLKVNYH